MKFEEYYIAEGIKTSISKLGFKRPTDIQFKSIPPILNGEDVLAIAQTGTGKTAAYAIPVLHILQDRKIKGRPDGVKCLVMVPTHELALQTENVFRVLGKHTRVTSFSIHGGVEQDPQIKRNLLSIRDQLNSAAISTIHAFCARTLREFPIESGLSPDFNEMDEMQQLMLFSQ